MNLGLSGERSIYLQIGEKIEDDILRGILLEEERVPSTNELARAYAINPATAAKGINLLVDQGIISREEFIAFLESRDEEIELVMTGRNCPPGIESYVDFISRTENTKG